MPHSATLVLFTVELTDNGAHSLVADILDNEALRNVFCVYRLVIRESHEEDEEDNVLITVDLIFYPWSKLVTGIA
jgi:hypothetical protein